MIENSINDFDPKYDDFGVWTVRRHLEEHARQTGFLREQAGQVDVVITHWPPTLDAVARRFKDNVLNGYFVNDNEGLVHTIGAQVWISGHVHDAYRAVIGDTLVMGNPTGYPFDGAQKPLFRPDLAIDVEPLAATEWQD